MLSGMLAAVRQNSFGRKSSVGRMNSFGRRTSKGAGAADQPSPRNSRGNLELKQKVSENI